MLQPTDPLSIGGRGLQIVDHFSLDWGVTREVDGKVVWFEFEGTPAA